MIVLMRNDGHSLNLSAANSFIDHPRGLIVGDVLGDYYLTSIKSLHALQQTVGHGNRPIAIIGGYFEAWPNDTDNR